jgi:hypothetical protein
MAATVLARLTGFCTCGFRSVWHGDCRRTVAHAEMTRMAHSVLGAVPPLPLPLSRSFPSVLHPHYHLCVWLLTLLQTDVSVNMSVGDVMAALTAGQESGRLPQLRDDTSVPDQIKALAWDSAGDNVCGAWDAGLGSGLHTG